MKKLKELLNSEKATITKMWLDRLFGTYSGDAVKLFKGNKDQFSNPVGHMLSEGIQGTFEALVDEDNEKLIASLDKMIRIRSVQDLSASECVSFVFFLKDILRKALKSHLKEPSVVTQLAKFDASIDEAALAAFDVYVTCRNQFYEIRVSEVKRNISQILKMTGYFGDDLELNPNREPGKP